MSESGAAVNRGVDAGDDCPLCLEPLPPFWDSEWRVTTICCGKYICNDCKNNRDVYLDRAVFEGSYGRQEQQLGSTCPLCRTLTPKADNTERMMMGRFEKGELPLTLYRNLGCYFLNGEGGVERNVQRGIEIYVLGAEKGEPICQFTIGCGYREGGYGLPKSRAKAKKWYLAAAEQGHAIAEFSLAIMAKDEGNYADYLRYLSGSASKGYNKACYNLGLDYYNGECGAQKSMEDAIRVLTPAAERGHAKSMGFLGCVMCQPDPPPAIMLQPNPQLPLSPAESPNFIKGVQWLRRAAATGDETSITKLKAIEGAASSMCFRCKKIAPEETFLRCSQCRAAWYCSKDCQVQHWKAAEGGHKQCCIKWE